MKNPVKKLELLFLQDGCFIPGMSHKHQQESSGLVYLSSVFGYITTGLMREVQDCNANAVTANKWWDGKQQTCKENNSSEDGLMDCSRRHLWRMELPTIWQHYFTIWLSWINNYIVNHAASWFEKMKKQEFMCRWTWKHNNNPKYTTIFKMNGERRKYAWKTFSRGMMW